MRQIAKIDLDQSIKKQKLVFEEEWLDKFDRFTVYLFFSGIVIYPIILLFNLDIRNNNDKFIYFAILPLPILFGLYVIYRKATEKQLFQLKTPHNKQKNRKILLGFANKQKYEIYKKSNECLIFNNSIGDLNSSYKKSMVFIVDDNMIYYTILKDQFKLNLPTLTSHIFLKNDLKNYIDSQV